MLESRFVLKAFLVSKKLVKAIQYQFTFNVIANFSNFTTLTYPTFEIECEGKHIFRKP